eukprot:GGOE01017952.1.p2 GENE.GGOE01017952.1~~GGOE01017952.1.p2  ORF type:complete len:183 (-),score=30.28 GGOE01017952.1:338-886(-)
MPPPAQCAINVPGQAAPHVASHVLRAGYLQWGADGGCLAQAPCGASPSAPPCPSAPCIAPHVLSTGNPHLGMDAVRAPTAAKSPVACTAGSVPIATHILHAGYLQLISGSNFCVALQGTYVDISGCSREMNHPALEAAEPDFEPADPVYYRLENYIQPSEGSALQAQLLARAHDHLPLHGTT